METTVNSRVARSNDAHFKVRRRGLRKGTHSCWECKRRKMKCVFDSLTPATACNGCRRRGSPCVSQEFPEEVSLSLDKTSKRGDSSTGTGNVRTSTSSSENGRRADSSPLTPVSVMSEPSRHLAFYEHSEHRTTGNANRRQPSTHMPAPQGKFERLSRFLHQSLPPREDTERILKASPRPSVLAHEVMTMPYTSLNENDPEKLESLLETPGPNLHPVLIARHMLLLASILQHLHPDLHEEIKDLSESPRTISERLADLAISLVTTKDELLGSIEGLECIMIESVYQANMGNLRRSWVSGRRAVGIAQLMGLNRSDHCVQYQVLDSKTQYDPQIMWFRILFLDRFLCLMLGLPQACVDRRDASEAAFTKYIPMERLEQIHCMVTSRILERNESDPNSQDLALTRTLDLELQKAARSLPSKWWLAPNLEVAPTDSQALFWTTRRLFAQVLHYNLLNQLHLPYMLCFSSADRKNEYSQITCVNASREVLSRFIALRSFNGIAYSCRIVDFLALMAAMTLLLAHLDSHLSEADNYLGHQYQSDRAMIEQVQENMRGVNSLNSDTLSARSADLLGRLLAIEAETTGGDPDCARRVSVHEARAETAPPDQDDNAVVSVHIPYFGIIKIAREGVSMADPESPSTTAATSRSSQLNSLEESSSISTQSARAEAHIHPSETARPSANPNMEAMAPVHTGHEHVEAPAVMSGAYANTQAQLEALSVPAPGANNVNTLFASQPQNGLSDSVLQHGEYPGLAAGGEDWAFQGVDLAFFNSLMRSAGNERNRGAELTAAAEMTIN